MFNLFRSQAKVTRYLLGGLMLMIAASMLTYLTNTGLTSTSASDTVIADVAGQKVQVADVQAGIDRLTRGGQLPADAVDVYLPQFVEQQIQQKAIVQAAQDLGITVSDEEVLTGLVTTFPQYFTNGKLSQKDAFEQMLAQQNLTMQSVVDGMRDQLMVQKLQRVASDSVVITPQDVDNSIVRKYETAQLEYIAFPGAKFRDQVKVTPEEARAAFDKNQSAYMLPAKLSFQVLVADQMKVEESINVSDAQLRAAYASSMDSFRMPERVEARHILLMTQGKSEAEKKAALTKAQDLLKQLKAGADFAKLAKENSQDPGSADKGGNLGFIVRGQTVPEFEKFIFSAEPKQMSDIITTQYGYHIIQVLSKEPARVKPFDEVKASIADELRKQGVSDKMQMIADQAHAALEKAPANAAEIAHQFGMDLVNVTDAKAGDPIPGLGAAPEVDNALVALKPNEVTAPIFLPSNRIAIAVLKSRTPSRPAQFADVEAAVRDKLIQAKADKLSLDMANKAVEELKAGQSIDQVAKGMKLDVVKPVKFTRNDSVEGLGPANFVVDSFTKPVGTVLGPVTVQGRYIVYKVTDRHAPDPKEFDAERAATITEIKQQKAQAEFGMLVDSVVSKLRADKKVKINEDTMKRLQASYRQGR